MREMLRGWLKPRVQPPHALLWLTALGMAVALGMLVLGGVILLNSRDDTWRQAEQSSNNLTYALGRDIARNITVYDLSLQGARDAMMRPDIAGLPPETRQIILFDRAASADYLGSILVLDQNGNIVADSTAVPAHKLSLADREYFLAQKDRPNAGMFISRPFRSRLRGGDASIGISRRVSRPDGTFGGVVVGSMRLAYFADLFSKLNVGSSGSVTLFRDDGRVIMRLPFRESDIDRDLGNTAAFKAYTRAESGTLVETATLDGVRRLYAFRHLKDLPLIVSVALAVDDVYAAWWRKAIGIGSVLIILCGATILLCLLFRREILRRMDAETGLRAAADHLETVASTDGLTGLLNRRTFDQRLANEWLRAIRTQTPVSLLMLDADYFKKYNDEYGHPKGDDVLRSIAGCIARNTLRPADTGARYGGEEFVVLLPDVEIQGALCVAERIRAAIAGEAIPHPGGINGEVSVSIGVAIAYPLPGTLAATLVADADEALYDAKHGGRNRVSAAGLPAAPAIVLPAGAA